MIGERIKYYIRAKGMNAEQAAEKLNISVHTLYKWYLKDSLDTKILKKIGELVDQPISAFTREAYTEDKRSDMFPYEIEQQYKKEILYLKNTINNLNDLIELLKKENEILKSNIDSR